MQDMFIIIYLKDTMDDIQTLIITSTTYISNITISLITWGIKNIIHKLINTQTIGNKIKEINIWNNAKIMLDVKK